VTVGPNVPPGTYTAVLALVERSQTGAIQGRSFSNLASAIVTLPAFFREPTHSADIAISVDGTQLWVANPHKNTVTKFGVNGSVLTTIGSPVSVQAEPTFLAISPNGRSVYVTNRASGTVSVIDSASRTVLRTLAVGTEPCGIAVSPNGTRAYVANAMSNSISVLDLSAKPERVMATIALPGREFFPFAVAVTNNVNLRDDDEKVYVTQFYGQLPDSLDTTNTGDTDTGRIGKITVLSSASNTIVQTVTLSPHLTGFTHDRKAFEGGGVSSVITPTFAFPNFLSDVVIKGNYGYVPATGMSPDGPVNFKTNTQSFVYVFDTRTDSEVVTATFNMNAAVDTHNAGTSTNTKVFLNTPWALAFSRTTTAAFVLSAASDVAMRMKLNPADGTPSLTGLSGTPTATTVVQVPANGRNPRGIVFDPTGARAFVHNYIGQNVTVLDAVANTIVRTAGAETAPGTAQAISALHGEELFDTSRQRMSSGGWGSCFSCHAFGWTDSVVWNFGNGPRKATPLNGSFSKSNPAHQRLLNWSAVNDEVEDFEVNIRTVSSNATGQGNNLNPPTGLISNRSTNTLTSTVLSSTTSGLASNWTDIKNYFQFGIRSPISPSRGATVSGSASVTNGRALFGSFGCAACHGGSGWTSSRRFYSPPPPSPTTNLVKAGQVQETLRKVGTFIGTEKTKDNTAAKGADGFNPPSLLGFWAFPPFLHNGRALTVEQVLTRSIAGTNHSTAGGLNRQPTAQEVSDLAAFLKSIDDRTPTFPNIAELRSDAISTGTTLSLSSSKLVIFTLTSDSDSSTAFVTSATLTFNGSTPITATLQSPAPSSIAPVSIAANGSVQFTFSVAAPSDATLASQAGTLTLALTDTYGARTLKRDVGTVTVQNPPVNLTIGSLQLPSTPLTLSRGQTFSVTLPLTNAVANSTTATLLGITIADSSGDVAYVANATLPSVLPANGVPTLIAYTATVGGGAIVGPHTATVTVTYRSVLAAGTQPSVSSNENNAAGYSIQPAPTVTSGPTKLDNRDSGDPDAEVETHSPANITSTFTWAVANATTAATAVVVAVTATASAPTGITVTRTDSITQISGGVTQTFGFTLSADTNASLGTNTLSVTATYLDKNRPSGDTSGGGQVTSDFHFQVVQSPQLTAAPVLPATVGRGETSVPLTLTFSNAAGSASAQVSSITFTFSTQASDVTTQYTATSPDFVQPFVIRAGDVLPLRFLVSVDAAAFTTRTTLTPNVAASDIKTLLPAAVSSTTATFVVTAPRPNLVILSARTNRAVVSANQTLNVTVTVRNTGGADATVNGGQLELLRGGTNVSSNFLVGAAALPALPVTKQGGIADVTFPITPQAAAVGDISADVSVTASGGSPVFMTEATSAAVTRFTVQSPATSGNVFIATAGPPGVDGEPALVSPAAVAVTLSSSAGTADFRVQQLSLSFAIGPDSVASQYRVTAPASLATVPTGGSTLFVFSVSPLDTATRAQPVTVTALAIGADVNTNITSSFSQSFTWVVRDAGGSNPAANATTNTSGTTPFLLFSPFAAVHDGNRLFVSDTDNNRILMFSPINSTVPAACIGQPDFLSRTPNNGTGGVAGGLSAPRGLLLVPPTAAAYSDTLFVADSGNHRVLVYKNVSGQSQFTTSSADLVYGHSLMSDESGPVSPSAMTFSAPASVALTSYLDITSVLRTPPTAIDTTITQHTRVYVADTGNNRVCVLEAKTTSTAVNAQPPPPASPPLPSSGSAAVLAVGQPSLVTSAVVSPPTANSLRSPEGVFVDTSTGRLVVSDSLNARVLVYAENSAIAGSGAGAQVALGEPGLTTDSGGLSISATTLSQPQGVWITTRTLFVADAFTHRVLRFKNFDALASGAPADFVLGQPSFATGTANNASFPPIDPFSLDTPFGVFSVFVPGVGGTHPSFNVIVGDRRNNRVQTYSIPFGP
ncbi:MAG: beta-propeller fold lactonase family protein, partial [Candidatus Wallbacteria bacterium]|nr:beta-propeller fold lactonase family protein [Candidatus Wallbacteria bacterium]